MASLVDRATSDMLGGPDWALNLELCDIVNRDPGHAKDVIKAIKKRLGNKSPKIQILALTVLETLVKNCSDAMHHPIVSKDILHEMVKIAKKNKDMKVKEKTLLLLDSWQEAFGGPKGKYPQYFLAYEEMRRAGAIFPPRDNTTPPIFTPPQTHPIASSSSSPPRSPDIHTSPHISITSEFPVLSLSDIENARSGIEVLSEMLNAIDPHNRKALEDEVIIELVDQCHNMERRVMQLVNSTLDEELLRQGLSLNDDLKRVLKKHDAIASGQTLPEEVSRTPVPHIHNNQLVDDSFFIGSSTGGSKPSKIGIPPSSGLQGKIAPPAITRAPTIDLLSGDMPSTVASEVLLSPSNNSLVQMESQSHDGGRRTQTQFLPSLQSNNHQNQPSVVQFDMFPGQHSKRSSQDTNEMNPQSNYNMSVQHCNGNWSQQPVPPVTDSLSFVAGQSNISGGTSLSAQQSALIYGATQLQAGSSQSPQQEVGLPPYQPQVLNYNVQHFSNNYLPGPVVPDSSVQECYYSPQIHTSDPSSGPNTAVSQQPLSPHSRNSNLPPAPWETESSESAGFPSSSMFYGNQQIPNQFNFYGAVSEHQQTFNQHSFYQNVAQQQMMMNQVGQTNLVRQMDNLTVQRPGGYSTPGPYGVNADYGLSYKQSIPRKEEKPEDSLFKDLVDLAKTRKGANN